MRLLIHLLVFGTISAPVSAQVNTVRLDDVVFARRNLSLEENPSAVAAADVDGDDHPDLLVAGDRGITIFRGDGRGELIGIGSVPAGENPVDLDMADLDGNGSPDIAVANHETDYLTILLGDGKGGFQAAPDSPLRIEVSPHPHAVRANDLDGDGRADLVVDHRDARGLLIIRGIGKGTFESPGTLVDVGGDPYRGMAVGDIDTDGRPDCITPNSGQVAILLNQDPRALEFTLIRYLAATAPFAVELADLNGDDKLDVIAASDEGSSLVQVFLGDGRGGFGEANGSPFQAGPGGKKITEGDFNGDGVQDAAITSFRSSQVLVLLGGIDSIRTARVPAGANPWGLAAADLNGDGRDDLAITDYSNPRATVYLSLNE